MDRALNEQAFNLAVYVILVDRVALDGYSLKYQAKEIGKVIQLVFGKNAFTEVQLNEIANGALALCYDLSAA